MMQKVKENPQLRAAFRYEDHAFIDKSLLPVLQAADMFVWLLQKWFAENRRDQFLRDLLKEGGVCHWRQQISDLSFGMLALANMHYGVKSNRKYESQQGKIKKYTI